MNKYQRPVGAQYYFRMFTSAIIAVVVVGVISELFGWPTQSFTETINVLLPLPFLVVGFLLIFNFINRRFQKPSPEREDEHAFLMRTSKRVREELEYGKESFKELQKNESFQTFYQQAFDIYKNGESDTQTLQSISEDFSEEDPAYDAVSIVVDETTKMLEEKSEDPQQDSTEDNAPTSDEDNDSEDDRDF